MSLNEIPKFFHPDIRQLIDFALEDAWQELRREKLADAASIKRQLSKTIVALAAIGETDPVKMKSYALQTTRRTRKRGPSRRGASANKVVA